MGRRSSYGNGVGIALLAIVGIIFFILQEIVKIITDNIVVVLAAVLLLVLFFIFTKYEKYKTQKTELEEAERQRKMEIQQAEESERLKLEAIKKREEEAQIFLDSDDYELIVKYVEKYRPSGYFSSSPVFENLVKTIKYDWQLESSDIEELVMKEKKIQDYRELGRALSFYEPLTYTDYMKAAINAYGNNVYSVIDTLYGLMEDKSILPLQKSKEDLSSDINNLIANIEKEAFKRSLLSTVPHTSLLQIDYMNPFDFENYVADIFKAQGYSTRVTQASGDQGADIVMEKLGKKVVVQVKLYSQPVGNKAIQEVVAAKSYYNADHAMVVTNNYFTPSAIELAKPNNVELINRDRLERMIHF